MIASIAGLVVLSALVTAHGNHDQSQSQLAGPHEGLWYNTLPGDGGKQVSNLFDNISTQKKSATKRTRPTLYSPESQLSAACPISHAWPVMPRNTTLPS